MAHSQDAKAARETRLLCCVAFVCYSATLTSLVAFGYSLAVLAMSAAAGRVESLYTAGGNLLP